MKQRSPIAVFLLGFVTIFIYSWYWQVKTKGEMNKLGEKIPTAWIWLIPIVGYLWWVWKYSEGVEHLTHEKVSGVVAFLVMWLLGPIGNAIIQDAFNKVQPAAAANPAAPAVAPMDQPMVQPVAQPMAATPPPIPEPGVITPTSAPQPTVPPPPTPQDQPPPPVVGG